MEVSNEDLINSAMNDDPVEQVETHEVETQQQEDDQNRDEQGRFAAKSSETQQQEQPQQREGFVPSGRLREEREAREAAERRFAESQAQWQRQFQELQARLPQPEQPKAPDVFENPNGFLEHGVRQQLDPVRQEVSNVREHFSKMFAVKEHGQEKVDGAYTALGQAIKSGDRDALSFAQRIQNSIDPYGEIVNWHSQKAVFSQIGHDPSAWFGKELESKLADPKFAAEIVQKAQGTLQAQTPPQAQNVFNVPPSLRRAPGSRGGTESTGDMSNASLLQEAMR